MRKKKQSMTTFEGGEGATAHVTVAKNTSPAKTVRKPDPHWVEMQKARKDKRDKRKRRPNEDIVWEGYKK
jgi:hypothetical protein